MKLLNLVAAALLASSCCFAQTTAKKSISIKKITGSIKLDGNIDDAVWKDAPSADHFIQNQPTPFATETKGDESDVRFLYSDAGIYVGGYMHEKSKDSIAAELAGRDGFGNNDFIGVVFDTYKDKLNGFEYFVTPLNEQWDAKNSPGSGEDFSWNAVWQSSVKRHNDGWSFEMFIPYSAIRFGKKNVQDWGLNIVRQRRKSAQKYFWAPLDPTVNGFLTQEGTLKGLENIKPPLRLQLSPYFSTYYNHGGENSYGIKSGESVNGGMDVKYGLNQAFTLDMTLIPDFGQVQTDNLTLNLSPFERKYAENRPFFTEGTELFSKGNLFYSRRIGGQPLHYYDYTLDPNSKESVVENPAKSKLVNATKISGRTQSGLGVGVLNAITRPTYAVIADSAGHKRKFETDPMTNYNVFVLDQTLKNNSSVSFVNTSVIRSGPNYDADVAAALFDFNDRSNTWNTGGNISVSNIVNRGKAVTGYYHYLYFGKTSGRFNFQVSQELLNDKFNKNDLGFFTNNNSVNNGAWASYNWNKPKSWYNRININANLGYSRLVKPIDILKGKQNMFETFDFNSNGDAQTKGLWTINYNFHLGTVYNDFYEARDYGRVFRNKGSKGISLNVQTNGTKKLSGSAGLFTGTGGVFHRTSFSPNFSAKLRFNSKFSIANSVAIEHDRNQPGFADLLYDNAPTRTAATDTILFSRRNIDGVENVMTVKYSINNRSSFNLRARHSFTKVAPVQIYQLNTDGSLRTPDRPHTPGDYNQNYNFFSVDMSYNWEFTQGSFLTVSWKNIGQNIGSVFEKNYTKNLGDVVSGKQFTSFSVKLIYFLDYAAWRAKAKKG